MQPQERRFADTAPQQPVYRFQHQNTPAQGWQPQGTYQYPQSPSSAAPVPTPAPLSRKEQRRLKRLEKKKRRRPSLIWNIFAVIGIVTVIVQAVRYVVIPLLVYLNVLAGGGL